MSEQKDGGPAFPMQPLVRDPDGVIRFRGNRIVRFLLDAGPFDLNSLALMPWEDQEREQLAQLIGYSVDGFGELDYVSNDAWETAIAHARTDVPGLVAAVRERGKRIAKLEADAEQLAVINRRGDQS
jgi:hypothetical protein